MGLLHRPGKIHDGQEHKDRGLDETHQNAQKEDRQGSQGKACKGEEDPEDLFLPEDITEEPNAERHDAGEMSDHLDHKHQGSQGPDRTEEVLDILGAVELDPDDMRHDEGAQRQGQGRIQVSRR